MWFCQFEFEVLKFEVADGLARPSLFSTSSRARSLSSVSVSVCLCLSPSLPPSSSSSSLPPPPWPCPRHRGPGSGRGDYIHVMNSVRIPMMIIGITSDVLYPVNEQEELADYLGKAKSDDL